MPYEWSPLARQKLRYNCSGDPNSFYYQMVRDGVKLLPKTMKMTVYAPGNGTPILSDVELDISWGGKSVGWVDIDTTDTDLWPIATGYRAHMVCDFTEDEDFPAIQLDEVFFDVAPFVLNINVGRDQLLAVDERIAGMAHAGDEDFSEVIVACRDELQARIESHVLGENRLLETMILDHSRVSIPARYLILARIFESKRDFPQADRYMKIFDDLWGATLSSIQYDKNQDGEEDSRAGQLRSVSLRY